MSSPLTSGHMNGTCMDGPGSPKNANRTAGENKFSGNNSHGEATDDVKATQQHIKNLETDLRHARDALSALKADRKRLKAEKFDVLNQMKQLYATLEDKEKELRDFIRSYEKRMRETEAALRQLIQERNEAEREKWTILRHARDEAERCLNLTTQLAARDGKIIQLQEELSQLRVHLTRQMSNRLSPTAAAAAAPTSATTTTSHPVLTQRSSISSMDSTVVTSDPCEEPLYSRIDHSSSTESQAANHDATPGGSEDNGKKRDEINVPLAADSTWKSSDQLSLTSFGSRTLGKISHSVKTNNGGAWGSISRVFSRNKQRKTLDLSLYDGPGHDNRRSWSPHGSLCTTPLAEETADRFRHWDEAQSLAVERWKAGHVLAWLEFGLGMAKYLQACAENIKSGKVLLELSDTELEAGLGLEHPMHRKKVRLAIEERRLGSPVRYPFLPTIGNAWVTNEWLSDIGLTQYTDSFNSCLMDARLLDNLTKRELEKHLGITRKAHQSSIVQGITFLRMIKYDRQAIAERRKQCENTDCDPLVWTNQRFITWAKSIDLGEYAENLRESGIHGAFVVLDPAFNADVMATAMGIPNSKNIIRRHLATELESLVQVARARYEQRSRQARAERKRAEKMDVVSLGRSLSRSFTTGLALSSHDREEIYGRYGDSNTMGPKSIMRASLSRAFGRKIKQERMSNPPPTLSLSRTDDHDALIAIDNEHSSIYSEARNWTLKKSQVEKHRRVKSSSDIESITITRV